jgi:hypothetical protein
MKKNLQTKELPKEHKNNRRRKNLQTKELLKEYQEKTPKKKGHLTQV